MIFFFFPPLNFFIFLTVFSRLPYVPSSLRANPRGDDPPPPLNNRHKANEGMSVHHSSFAYPFFSQNFFQLTRRPLQSPSQQPTQGDNWLALLAISLSLKKA